MDAIPALGGNAGWVGASLLGSVLAWLMFVHIPAKDKMVRELLTSKDAQLDAAIQGKEAAAGEMTAVILAHCARTEERLMAMLERFEKRLYPEAKT